MKPRKALLPLALLALLPTLFVMTARGKESSHAAIERGRYLAAAGDCAACHTAPGGKPYAGGLAVPTPFGTIYSTNITPDKDTGIGAWSDDEFYRAMHEGIARNGEHLYPAFPYPWFTKLTREDVDALKAYLETIPAVRQADKAPELPWPLSQRGVMAAWNKLYFHEGTYQPDPQQSAEWNRGAYLVEGPGHCGACHTSKNFAGAPKKDQHLEGGYGENWYATSLTNDVRDGLGDWSVDEVVRFLKTGSNAHSAATGPMAEVVQHSTQHLSEADLRAIAVYLKSQPAPQDEQRKVKTAQQSVLDHGRGLYLDQCQGCHLQDGQGEPGLFPPLKSNAVVQADDPETMIHIILRGAHVVKTAKNPTGLSMPAFDWKLTDAEIADLATYLRQAWGNHAGSVEASKVEKVRKAVRQASTP